MHFLFSSSVIPLKSVQIFCREPRTILENFAEITRFGPIALKSKEKKEEEKGRKKEIERYFRYNEIREDTWKIRSFQFEIVNFLLV